jgi:ABC-type sugar transport system substrate-binding protein
MLEGEPGGETAAQRTQGFHDGIKKYPGIEIVSSITGHWTLPGGVEATEAIIAANKDIDLIFAASDMIIRADQGLCCDCRRNRPSRPLNRAA